MALYQTCYILVSILPYRPDRPPDHRCLSFYIHHLLLHQDLGHLPGLMGPHSLQGLPAQIRWPVRLQPMWELTWTRVIVVMTAKKQYYSTSSCGFQSLFLLSLGLVAAAASPLYSLPHTQYPYSMLGDQLAAW